jgi:hypothetical protein
MIELKLQFTPSQMNHVKRLARHYSISINEVIRRLVIQDELDNGRPSLRNGTDNEASNR